MDFNEAIATLDLVGLQEKLNDFAKHHHNKGGQAAHRLIRAKMKEEKSVPRDGKRLEYYKGFDDAIKLVLGLLHENFVP